MAMRQIPGFGYVIETANVQRQIPGGPYIDETLISVVNRRTFGQRVGSRQRGFLDLSTATGEGIAWKAR